MYSMNIVACTISLQTILSSYAYEERQDLIRKDMKICIKTNNRQDKLKERKGNVIVNTRISFVDMIIFYLSHHYTE